MRRLEFSTKKTSSMLGSRKNRKAALAGCFRLVEQIDPNTNIQSYVGGLAITIIL